MNLPRLSWLIAIALVLVLLTYSLYPPTIPLSPLASPQTAPIIHNSKFIILGFSPYWLRAKITETALKSITHYAYFALLLSDDGSLYTHVNPREQEPGYTNYRRLLSSPPSTPLILTFMPESQDALESILSSPSHRAHAVATITKELQVSGSTGVNVDFEPLGTTPPSLRRNFTLFIQELHSQLSTISHQQLLTISIYPSAASRPRLWDLSSLAPFTNYFVVMTYDYHLPGDNQSGPNSPLRGAGQLFEHDVVKNLAEITSHVDPSQILLGLPFYGYEWDVDSSEKYTLSTGRAAVASLERIQSLIDQNVLELLWDRNSLTPYAVRREDGQVISQIYYENAASIQLKLDLVRSAGLGGIAIWALGYEGSDSPIWSTIRSLNR